MPETKQEVLQRFAPHYADTMGGVPKDDVVVGDIPQTLALLADLDPLVFEGYSLIRQYAMAREPEGHMPLKYKHLILVALDLARENQKGACNHIREAIREGLDIEEVRETLALALMVEGIVMWGKIGKHVLAFAEEFAAEFSAREKS